MAKLNFKTQEGQTKATELIKDIFCDFDKVETEFSESGYGVTVTIDNCFEYSFTEDNLTQTKRLLMLLELKKLDKLTNCKKVSEVPTAQTLLQDLYDKCFEEENEHTLTVDSHDILNIAKRYGMRIDE